MRNVNPINPKRLRLKRSILREHELKPVYNPPLYSELTGFPFVNLFIGCSESAKCLTHAKKIHFQAIFSSKIFTAFPVYKNDSLYLVSLVICLTYQVSPQDDNKGYLAMHSGNCDVQLSIISNIGMQFLSAVYFNDHTSVVCFILAL